MHHLQKHHLVNMISVQLHTWMSNNKPINAADCVSHVFLQITQCSEISPSVLFVVGGAGPAAE